MEELEGFQSVKRLGNKVKERTFINYKRFLRDYFVFRGLSPDQCIEEKIECMKQENPLRRFWVEDQVNEFLNSLRRYASNTVSHYKTAVQSFYRHNHVRLDGDELVRFEACTEKVISNPRRETLKRIVDVAELRDKALILLMAQSGLSVANVVELRLENIDFNRDPSLITTYRGKSRIPFHSFIHPEAKEYLDLYFEERRRGTRKIPPEELTPQSPVLVSKYGRGGIKGKTVWDIVVNACKRAGVKHHSPHSSFRSYFANACRRAGVHERFVDYMLGHKVKMGGAYFPVDDLEDHYKKAIPELSIAEKEKREITAKELLPMLIKALREAGDEERAQFIKVVRQTIDANARITAENKEDESSDL